MTYAVFSTSDACELTLDQHTAHRKVELSDNNRTASAVREGLYHDSPNRFDCCQILCENPLTDCSYWEVQWEGNVLVAVTYKGIRKRGNSKNCWFGRNHQSWSLQCSNAGYSVWYDNREVDLHFSVSHRVAVYVDHPGGTLSFYKVSSKGDLTLLHTFHCTFSEPLYPSFAFGYNSSVSLCEL